MFPSYPPAIIRDAPEPPTKAENRFYWLWICFGELLPLLIYGAVSMAEGGTHGFWQMALTGYIQWMMINLCDLFVLDIFLIQKKAKRCFVIPGTERHPGYGFQVWMKRYALPEHLLQWPLILCPLMAALQAGLVMLLGIWNNDIGEQNGKHEIATEGYSPWHSWREVRKLDV